MQTVIQNINKQHLKKYFDKFYSNITISTFVSIYQMFYTTNELILRTKEKHTVFDIKTTYNRT